LSPEIEYDDRGRAKADDVTRPFSLTFRQKMIERMSGVNAESARKVARDTGVSQETLSRWLLQARSLPLMPPPKRTSKVWSIDEKIRVLAEAAKVTMLATLQWLGIVPSFSRPHVCDDNPYSEALFRTLKQAPSYPSRPFPDLLAAQRWVADFVSWYNGAHHHSAIRYVTPDEGHFGRDQAVLARRHELYERAKRRRPERWSRGTRNWMPVGSVVLNPLPTSSTSTAA
jgi:putative transposase